MSVLLLLCLVSFWHLSIGVSGVLKSPTITVWVWVCNLSFSNAYFTSVVVLAFVAKMFRIEMSSW